ncbi:major outer membrane protein [Helicobacter cholecystus]|uniref:Major outer membrane protein n=1 Tax=Helicobacter cholecystus TaxID=45498 RepID=A0A3D8IY55_9HELI|nr:major outer membrane protein [Helicobacter cholecystus]RDU69900.1 major outer membrane protein [Helicobacter cholecystus]VEJ25058.1 outer membrane protein [Helicobacter cholecystus]
MKMTKTSLAALAAMGALTCANAETSLEEAIKGTTISGYVYGQLTSMFGDDASGSAFRSRVFTNIKTGGVGGFNIGSTAIATIGGGAPDGGDFISNSTRTGSVADTLNLGLLSLYGNMNFSEYGSKTTLMAGKVNILTSFNDNVWDFGYGVYVKNEDIEGVKISAQALGAWSLDNNDFMSGGTSEINSNSGLFIAGVEAGGEKLAGASIKFYAGHATKTIDYMLATDLAYTISGITIQTQVAVADVDVNSYHFAKIGAYNEDLSANLRGLYNIQLAYTNKDVGFSAKGGFTGSFGDGYGALLNNSSFNMGGQFWYDTLSSGANGYGLAGAGGMKYATGEANSVTTHSTDIMVGYVGVAYTGVKSLKLGLDYAFVGGNNNYALMKKGKTNPANTSKKNLDPNGHINATFHEVSFTASYGFFDNKLMLSGLIGSTFGDLQMARARMKVQYSF